jgi:hypothetical protein
VAAKLRHQGVRDAPDHRAGGVKFFFINYNNISCKFK